MAYCFDEEPVQFWWHFEPFPQEVLDYFKTGGEVMAHNAEFERHLFDYVLANDYDFTPPKLEQWRCSMAMALVSGYPAGLGALAEALGLRYRKQAQGTRLIREYCSPNFFVEFKPDDKELMKEYCVYDVLVMRDAVKCLRVLTELEWREYHLSCRINDRGIPVDVEFGLAALKYAEDIAADASRQISDLTGGKVTKHTQRKARDAWLMPRLTEQQKKLLIVHKKGEPKVSLDQDHRGYLLSCDDLDSDARKLLEFIDDAGSSTLKKYSVAANQHVNGLIYNTFLWNGAQTGRFSGKGLQPHNFRRDVYDQEKTAELIEDVSAGYVLDRPADTLAKLLRGLVHSEENLYFCDWAAIEGRVAPWLITHKTASEKLELFRAGRDIYKVTAAKMFGGNERTVSDEQRQAGKIAELSLQFGGGKNALIGMAKNYGITFTDVEAERIVDKWRSVNRWAEYGWRQYDNVIIKAIKIPNKSFTVGLVEYQSDGVNFLWCRLPSGRLLSYPKPRWEPYTTPWGAERVGATFQTHHRPAAGEPALRNHLRGALLFQNTVQAVAADILRTALLEADRAGLHIVAHVHDEIIGSGCDGDKLNEIMLKNPVWADGLPLATGGVVTGQRWGK
jgi:DNA polymerase